MAQQRSRLQLPNLDFESVQLATSFTNNDSPPIRIKIPSFDFRKHSVKRACTTFPDFQHFVNVLLLRGSQTSSWKKSMKSVTIRRASSCGTPVKKHKNTWQSCGLLTYSVGYRQRIGCLWDVLLTFSQFAKIPNTKLSILPSMT